jgi:uncharacterized Tic20 family protein
MLEISTPALLFPAISLLLLAFTNRFLTIGQLIRQLKKNADPETYQSISKQILNLKQRLNLIIVMQALGVLSILSCTLSMALLFADNHRSGQIAFVISLILMVASLVISLWEILISGKALQIELQEMKDDAEVTDPQSDSKGDQTPG